MSSGRTLSPGQMLADQISAQLATAHSGHQAKHRQEVKWQQANCRHSFQLPTQVRRPNVRRPNVSGLNVGTSSNCPPRSTGQISSGGQTSPEGQIAVGQMSAQLPTAHPGHRAKCYWAKGQQDRMSACDQSHLMSPAAYSIPTTSKIANRVFATESPQSANKVDQISNKSSTTTRHNTFVISAVHGRRHHSALLSLCG